MSCYPENRRVINILRVTNNKLIKLKIPPFPVIAPSSSDDSSRDSFSSYICSLFLLYDTLTRHLLAENTVNYDRVRVNQRNSRIALCTTFPTLISHTLIYVVTREREKSSDPLGAEK